MRNADREAIWDRQVVNLGNFVKRLVAGGGLGGLEDGVLDRISIKVGGPDDPGVLCVLKATRGGESYVAFVGGRDVEQMVYTWAERDRAGKLKWTEDVPWEERSRRA